jgi:transcriptional regulator with XRE-family HTH domain
MTEARDVSNPIQTAAARTAYLQRVPASESPRGDAFGALIRESRQRKGWTQDRLVEESGVSRATITRWEAGDARRPDPEQVRAVCAALGVDPRLAAVALGYLSQEDIAPSGPRSRLDPTIEEVIAILQDPNVADEQKADWIDYLRFLRDRRNRRAAG